MAMALLTYEDIVDLLKKGATVEAQERIMELREAVIALQEENFGLRQKTQELEAALKLKGEVEFDGAVYWRSEGGKRVGPYCPQCLDAEDELVRLQDFGDAWFCTKHKQSFTKRFS
jgi:hypothetical protein